MGDGWGQCWWVSWGLGYGVWCQVRAVGVAREKEEKNRSVGARAPRPTFLVRSTANSCSASGLLAALLLGRALAGLSLGRTFRLLRAFFLGCHIYWLLQKRAPHANKVAVEPGVLRFRPAPPTLRVNVDRVIDILGEHYPESRMACAGFVLTRVLEQD
jgi:hypothetical protein